MPFPRFYLDRVRGDIGFNCPYIHPKISKTAGVLFNGRPIIHQIYFILSNMDSFLSSRCSILCQTGSFLHQKFIPSCQTGGFLRQKSIPLRQNGSFLHQKSIPSRQNGSFLHQKSIPSCQTGGFIHQKPSMSHKNALLSLSKGRAGKFKSGRLAKASFQGEQK